MKSLKPSALLFLVLAALATGCGTLSQHFDPDGKPGPYSGIRADVGAVGEFWTGHTDPESLAILAHCDMPLSLVADTLFLPYDLTDPKPWSQSKPSEPPPMQPNQALQRTARSAYCFNPDALGSPSLSLGR